MKCNMAITGNKKLSRSGNSKGTFKFSAGFSPSHSVLLVTIEEENE
jgi:hypothetical protein